MLGFKANICKITVKFKFITNCINRSSPLPDFIIYYICPTIWMLCSRNYQLVFVSISSHMIIFKSKDHYFWVSYFQVFRSSIQEVFLSKGVLKICSKFTGEHSCRSVSNFIKITLPYSWSPVNLLHIFRIPFPRNSSGWLLSIVSSQTEGVISSAKLQILKCLEKKEERSFR